jgi:arylsulfatase A-like enzyme
LVKNTLIIITADHGEYLGDHGFYFMHGGLYDTIIKIPLIMKCEGIFPHGKIIDQQISSIDIIPTILSVIKIKAGIKTDGMNLLPVIFGRRYNAPYAFSEFMNPQGIFTKSITDLRINNGKYGILYA